MEDKAVVRIIGAPVACAEGTKDTWREVAQWAANRLELRFGEAVRLEYYDLFDPACPLLPEGAQLPCVLVNGEVVSSGEKISLPLLIRRLEQVGAGAVGAPERKRS